MSRRDAVARGRRPELELGEEPALSEADGLGRLERHRICSRWLAGTILTGLASAGLLGGALYACLDRQSRFAEAPQLTTDAAGTKEPVSGRKADRLAMQASTRLSFKQVVQLDTVTRVGDREYIKVKPFVRVSAPLALSRTSLTAGLPPFNPLKLFGEADAPARVRQQTIEAEVALVIREFDDRGGAVASVEPPPAEIHALIREAAQSGAKDAPRLISAYAPADLLPGESVFATPETLTSSALGFGGAGLTAYGSAVRAWTENVTMVAKSARGEAPTLGADERIVSAQKGDKLIDLLTANGATPAEAQAMVDVIRERFQPDNLPEGIRLRLSMSGAEDDRMRLRPVRVSVYEGDEHKATAVLSDNGGYVALDDPGDFAMDADAVAENEEEEEEGPIPNVYMSLYETALKLELPKSLVDSLVRIYSYDIDFQRRVQPGDSFEVFFSADEKDDILYAALTLKGETRRYYRFQIPGEDSFDFYDETGKSAKKFLMQKPLVGGSMSSGFGMRRHPILGYRKMHTGVDWRAPRGTPIMASGNGSIEKAGWESGYGRYVRIRHSNGYQTAYGHMSGFAKGISAGARVRQGQIIGYVGSTGMSTGNHLHYEVLINERLVNPLSIKVPRGRTLQGDMLGRFMQERERIDGAMNRAPASSRLGGSSG